MNVFAVFTKKLKSILCIAIHFCNEYCIDYVLRTALLIWLDEERNVRIQRNNPLKSSANKDRVWESTTHITYVIISAIITCLWNESDNVLCTTLIKQSSLRFVDLTQDYIWRFHPNFTNQEDALIRFYLSLLDQQSLNEECGGTWIWLGIRCFPPSN